MKIQIRILERRLSDASVCYDVMFGDMLLLAITERDANHLVDKLVRAVEAHTNEIAEVELEYERCDG